MAQQSSSTRFEKDRKVFFLLIFGFFLYLAYKILEPFLNTIIISILLASLFYPYYTKLLVKVKGRKTIASLLTSFLMVFLIVVPAIVFTTALVEQGVKSVSEVQTWIKEGNLQKIEKTPTFSKIKELGKKHLRFLDIDKLDIQGTLLKATKNFGQYLLSKGAGLLSNVAGFVMRFFIMIFLLYYLLRDGPDMLTKIKYLSPLRPEQEDRIFERIKAVSKSALLGTFVTAIAQGVAGGIGLAISGIPGFFWGAMMGFASLIPVVGTAIIWIPACVYLLIVGKSNWAIFLAIWCIVIVGSLDNFLRPFLMKGEAQMSPFFVFLAIIGGIQVFGLIGIIYGPLILGICAVFIYLYQVEYAEMLGDED
ncbi:MAG TPA: AI-2E family transporter [Deltaproteobacteria bacterium]|nr:AI-2E family transporter [Deltaproteobacteria bacterium]